MTAMNNALVFVIVVSTFGTIGTITISISPPTTHRYQFAKPIETMTKNVVVELIENVND